VQISAAQKGDGPSYSIMPRRETVTPRTTLNARNLEVLGAARLAELLIEMSTGNAAANAG
jgi:Family of unknown function (DUF6880)